MDTLTGVLVPSSNRRRYAVDEPDGCDLISGDRCEVYLGGQWMAGSVEHGSGRHMSRPTMAAWVDGARA